MEHRLVGLLFRLLLCFAVAYVAWRRMGLEGLVYSALAFGVALAKPIAEGVASAFWGVRSLSYRGIEGRHFSYLGKSIDVAEDDYHFRWLSLVDVRAILPNLPRDETLRSILGAGVTPAESSPPRIKAEALHGYLSKATTRESGKFRIWVERTIIYPSAKARAMRGMSVSDQGTRGSL